MKVRDFTDYWSIPHFLAGFFFLSVNNHFFRIKQFWAVFILSSVIHLIYEIKDYIVTYIPGVFDDLSTLFPTLTKLGIIHNHNSLCNIYGDQFYFMVGLLFAYRYQKYTNVGTILYIITVVYGCYEKSI